ncbi:MAG TPA: LLM class flavin-dependent oxidoreductase, partial [Thermomicrobiales bacterium]|nr:LLM class flavin-dependent oxidoreductase [Thermomicrobiales bacterium]
AAQRTLTIAAAADAGGIDVIAASDDPDSWDAFALLGAVATVARRARLGPSVANPVHRHPNLIAASIATLDRLSGGRAVLGLGRGQPEWYERALGIDSSRPLARLAETIELLRQWGAPPHRAASRSGDVFAVRDWARTIHPVQAHVPVYLAAAGPQALALAARAADGVIFNNLTSPAFIAETIPLVRDAARGAGRDPAALAFILRTAVQVTDDPAAAIRAAKDGLAVINTLPGMARLLTTPGFDIPAIVAAARQAMRTEEALAAGLGFADLRAAGDIAAARAAIPDDLVAQLVIAGDLAHVRARLAHLAALGVTQVSVKPPPEPTSAAWRELLDALRG